MKVAIIGSRKLTLESIGEYLPKETTEIVSGGAQGIDACAKKYAYDNGIKYTEFLSASFYAQLNNRIIQIPKQHHMLFLCHLVPA